MTGPHPPIRSGFSAALLAMLLVPALRAQEGPVRPAIELLEVDYGIRAAVDDPAEPATAGADFRIGRDNLAFSNLTGIWGDPGDCYAFTLTAKLFFEGARWNVAGDGERGFQFADLVQHFEGGGSEPFTVQGYSSLFDMSNAPDLTEDQAVEYLRGGPTADGSTPVAELRGRRKMKYQLIMFLNLSQNLVQSQAELAEGVRQLALSRLTRLGRSPAAGIEALAEATRAVTRESVQAIKDVLRAGRVCPISMIGLNVLGGHAVLAYKYVKNEDSVDFYVYDSNVQAGDERGESILRISHDARSITYHKKTGDRIVPDGIYDGSGFFSDKPGLAIIRVNGLTPDRMRQMAHTVAFSDQVNVFLDSANRFVEELGREDRTLRRVIRDFILDVQRTHRRLGLSYIDEDDRITEDSGVRQINAYLETYGLVALRAITPHALPAGIKIDEPRIVLDGADENLADVSARVTVAEGSPVPAFVRSIRAAGLLMNDRDLADWMSAVQRRVGEVNLDVRFGMRVRKSGAGGASMLPSSLADLRGVVPELRWLHGVIGKMDASNHDTFVRHSPFRVEISKGTLQDAVDVAAARLKLYGSEDAQILRIRTDAGDLDVRLESVRVGLERSDRGTSGVIALDSHVRMMLMGHELAVNPLSTRFRIDHDQAGTPGRIRVSGRLLGVLDLPSGLKNLSASTAIAVLDANSDGLRRLVNDVLADDLLEQALGFGLVRFASAEQVSRMAVGPARISAVTDWSTVNLAGARDRYFNFTIPIDLCQFHVLSDRLVFAARPRGEEAE